MQKNITTTVNESSILIKYNLSWTRVYGTKFWLLFKYNKYLFTKYRNYIFGDQSFRAFLLIFFIFLYWTSDKVFAMFSRTLLYKRLDHSNLQYWHVQSVGIWRHQSRGILQHSKVRPNVLNSKTLTLQLRPSALSSGWLWSDHNNCCCLSSTPMSTQGPIILAWSILGFCQRITSREN